MTYEQIYTLINLAVMPAWLLLLLAPRANFTAKIVHSGLYPVAYGLLYSSFLCLALFFGKSNPGADMTTLAGVMTLFSHPNGALTGWSHYLVFDLFVGAWISRDAVRREMNQLVVAPCLFFTLMLGPIGLLLYLVLRKLVANAPLSVLD